MISEERIKEILTPIFIRQDQASIHWPDIFEEVRAIEAEVTAPLVAMIKQLEQENAAIRELMNCYNLGGWTDSLALITENAALALQSKQMWEALSDLFDKYEDGTACYDEPEYGTFIGYASHLSDEEFAQVVAALALPDLSTNIIKQHDNEVIERCAVLCEKSDRYRGDYFAEKIRALKQ